MTQGNPDRTTPFVIRSLTAADDEALARLSVQDYWRYLTPRLNLDAHGYEGPMVRAWGAFHARSGPADMAGIMLRYGNTAILADADGATAEAFVPVIDAEEGLAGVRGSGEVVRAARGLLRRYTSTGIEVSTLMRLLTPPRCPPETLALARRAHPDDLDMLAELYSRAWPMYRSRANVAGKLAETRVFVVEEAPAGRQPRRIASCALLNVEGREAGLIGGVYTLPTARGRGYAAACTAALCRDLQRDGKYPCLFYENPTAGRVYSRLGFEQVGKWAVLYLEHHQK
jgi:GNAT superfamily N-acetyltransferase